MNRGRLFANRDRRRDSRSLEHLHGRAKRALGFVSDRYGERRTICPTSDGPYALSEELCARERGPTIGDDVMHDRQT